MFVLRRPTRSLLAGLALASCSAAASSETFWGIGQAKDGDSLMVGSREVRLFGIDAPEFDQQCKRAGRSWACGSEARERLSQLATGRDVRCVSVETDQYGRFLSRCSAGGTDLNRAMVASGYAVAFRRYSLDYVSAEASAKAARRGLWSGEFEMPSEFRHSGSTISRPRAAGRGEIRIPTGSARTSPVCRIKGNRNRRGQWIYHLPGMPYYDQTRAEQTFCTEAEARAAGYRRAVVRP